MPNNHPIGFVTRPEAAKLYNRSQRALERDLDVALAIRDDEMLEHFRLVTKDGQIRHANDVVTEDVKRLISEGMSPAWLVEESWLDAKYGPKGTPKPRKAKGDPGENEAQSPEHQGPSQGRNQSESGSRGEPERRIGSDDVDYLKNQIQMLEQEKQQERKRHDTIVGKLFEQLAVKDKQISAWDDVTQGLTKALATGQLAPQLPGTSRTADQSGLASTVAPKATNNEDGPPAVVDVNPTTSSKKSDSPRNQVSRSRKPAPRKPSKRKSSPNKKTPAAKSKNIFEKHTPTLHKALGSVLRRS